MGSLLQLMQELGPRQQTTELAALLVQGDGANVVRVEIGQLRREATGMVFVAEFIHQSQRLCLFSAEHPSIGEALHCLQLKVSPLRHNTNELAIAAVDQLLKQCTFGIAQRTIRGKDVLERTALHRVEANP